MKDRTSRMFCGIAAGLLFDSLLLVATTGWLFFMIVPLLLPPLIGGILGVMIRRKSANRETASSQRRWVRRLLIVLLLWPLCACGPIGLRWLQLYYEAVSIPLCPGCTRAKIEVTVLAYDNEPGFAVELRAAREPTAVVEFYRRELVRLGWTAMPPRQVQEYTYYGFSKPRRGLSVLGWTTHGSANEAIHRIRLGCTASNFVYR